MSRTLNVVDSFLTFNLAATRWLLLWDSLHFCFPTVLWFRGRFSLSVGESERSHNTQSGSLCVFKITVKMVARLELH